MLKVFSAITIAATLALSSCAPKDADIQKNVEEKLKTNQSTATTVVMVNDGVATLSGELASDEAKAESEKMAKDAKGVKSVVNNITVKTAVVEAPVVVSPDASLEAGLRDATKDFPGVTATVMNGVVTLAGTIERAKLSMLMMSVNALHPQKVDNKLTVK